MLYRLKFTFNNVNHHQYYIGIIKLPFCCILIFNKLAIFLVVNQCIYMYTILYFISVLIKL